MTINDAHCHFFSTPFFAGLGGDAALAKLEWDAPGSAESLADRREAVRETYQKLSDRTPSPPLPFGEFRMSGDYEAFVLGTVVEKL